MVGKLKLPVKPLTIGNGASKFDSIIKTDSKMTVWYHQRTTCLTSEEKFLMLENFMILKLVKFESLSSTFQRDSNVCLSCARPFILLLSSLPQFIRKPQTLLNRRPDTINEQLSRQLTILISSAIYHSTAIPVSRPLQQEKQLKGGRKSDLLPFHVIHKFCKKLVFGF